MNDDPKALPFFDVHIDELHTTIERLSDAVARLDSFIARTIAPRPSGDKKRELVEAEQEGSIHRARAAALNIRKLVDCLQDDLLELERLG